VNAPIIAHPQVGVSTSLRFLTEATPIATTTLPAPPPILLLPPRRAGFPRADRLPAGETPTVSVMAIENEVVGSCVGEIDVSVGVENSEVWLCCGLIYLGFILAGKAPQDWLRRWLMVPGIGGRWGCLRAVEELKSPCVGRGFWS
jgi:hypothetical protein